MKNTTAVPKVDNIVTTIAKHGEERYVFTMDIAPTFDCDF